MSYCAGLICTSYVLCHVVQGLSGQSFSGPDIGGFAGDSTPKLFARWMGLGAMMPFARGHSEQGTIDQEPWSFGPEVHRNLTSVSDMTCSLLLI